MNDGILKELIKEPIVYVIGVIVFVGADLVNSQEIGNASWVVGVTLLVIAVVSFLLKLLVTAVDQNFRKKYTELIDRQASNIQQQQNIIDSLAINTKNAYDSMSLSTRKEEISGGYSIPGETSTTTTGES